MYDQIRLIKGRMLMRHPGQRDIFFVVVVIALGMLTPNVNAQLGIVTSVIGSGRITQSDGQVAQWRIGELVGEHDRIETDKDAFAMLFFVSGLGAEDIGFRGTIVIEIDQNTEVELRRGTGRRPPIDVHVLRGRVQAFFDAGQHKDFILLSTPRGELRVTGSNVFAAHNLPDSSGSTWGSFDSDCEVRLADGTTQSIARAQKVVVAEGQSARVEPITAAEQDSWSFSDALSLASATNHGGQVRLAYADRTWVGGWITGAQRLEDVAADRSNNIPSQEPELVSSAPTTTVRTAQTTPRDTGPRLRAAGSGRTAGEEDGGFGRETLGLPSSASRLNSNVRLGGALDSSMGLRAARSGRSVSGLVNGTARAPLRK